MLLSTQNHIAMNDLGPEGSIQTLKNEGFDAFDLSLFSISYSPKCVFNAPDYKEKMAELRRFADGIGMPCNQSHAPFSYNYRLTPNVLEERVIPETARAIEISAIMGAKHVVVHPLHDSSHVAGIDLDYPACAAELKELNMKFYRALLPYAKEYGVKIALENMWRKHAKRGCIYDSACSRATEFADWYDTLDDDNFICLLDIGHSGLVGEEPWDAIRILGHDRLKGLHVHDNDYKADQHTMPGMGNIDWEQVMKALSDIDYTGDFTFEADSFFDKMPREMRSEGRKLIASMGRYLISRFDYYQSQK